MLFCTRFQGAKPAHSHFQPCTKSLHSPEIINQSVQGVTPKEVQPRKDVESTAAAAVGGLAWEGPGTRSDPLSDSETTGMGGS